MSRREVKAGVLALQGDFEKHLRMLRALGVQAYRVRTSEELLELDGLVIPGGESTTMTRLLKAGGLEEALREFVKTKPVFGTCAGMVLLAKQIAGDAALGLGAIDIEVERNGFGRQIHSFSADLTLEFANGSPFHAVFIRAPRVVKAGNGIVPLAKLEDEVVMARSQNVLVASFHPELTDNKSVHEYFVEQLLK